MAQIRATLAACIRMLERDNSIITAKDVKGILTTLAEETEKALKACQDGKGDP